MSVLKRRDERNQRKIDQEGSWRSFVARKRDSGASGYQPLTSKLKVAAVALPLIVAGAIAAVVDVPRYYVSGVIAVVAFTACAVIYRRASWYASERLIRSTAAVSSIVNSAGSSASRRRQVLS